jgi:hypothetical protein
LRLDSLSDLLEGGESGKVVVPGQPENSRLIRAVNYEDADLQMPPKKRLSDRQVADLIEWVKLGVPWPEAEKNQAQRPNRPAFEITTNHAYWAFQIKAASTRGETGTLDSQSDRAFGPRELRGEGTHESGQTNENYVRVFTIYRTAPGAGASGSVRE